MIDIFYTKRNNNKLFTDFDNIVKIKDTQNYSPIYKCFFSLNHSNYNNINLNNSRYITNINQKISENVYDITYEFKTKNGNIEKKNIESFFKFIPIIDVTNFLKGKYHNETLDLPIFKNVENNVFLSSKNNISDKIHRENNQAYVDMFFNYLSSKLLIDHNFIHGIKFYGSFVGIKEKLVLNVADDIIYLYENEYFRNSKDILYEIDDFDESLFFENETRSNRNKLSISDKNMSIELDNIKDNFSNDFSGIFKLTTENLDVFNQDNVNFKHITEITDISVNEHNFCIPNYKNKNESYQKTNSTPSSRTSGTNYDEIDSQEDTESSDNSDSDSECETSSSLESEILQMTVFNYPIQIACLEKLNRTMDSIMIESIRNQESIKDSEWIAYLAQVVMMLITYQKLFDFTHNDLHTNNIMYVETKKQNLYYKVDSVHYKIPTYGKIFKIIDFGRAIYKYKDVNICSDCYYFNEDAGTQYNFPPYYNKDKPLLYPNKSFDLCRLGCALYNYLDYDDKMANMKLKKIINHWCEDYKGRNILYKKDGVERYEDFKLYKMIARTVNDKLPIDELKKHFGHFKVSKKNINKKNKIINIDKLEKCYI
tara:strand:+ start:2161 stop:3951 length:1791 start_codon:yes stop_codon:yes gene_type:complete